MFVAFIALLCFVLETSAFPCQAYDSCDICGGDDSSCLDCKAIPNGPNRYDVCDVCGGNGSTCADCTLNGSSVYDCCDVCGGDGSTCVDCRGICNGPNRYDRCDICGGNGQNDCRGIPCGPNRYDCCDVCGGDGSTCTDCNGVCNGRAKYDCCDVCGGDGSTCKDCKGICGGTNTYDRCNVCAGDGNSCKDCCGNVLGTCAYDQCDVCNGDGQSCPAAVGDPHITGANGVKFDFNGVAHGVYVLFNSPVFVVNMLLAPVGPETRFMTAIGIVYRGAAISVEPWSLVTRRDEIFKHFGSSGANVTFNGKWSMSVTFCANHVVTLTAMHSDVPYNVDGTALNYFDVAFSVPGCHDAYGGALGATYQCRYVLNKTPFGEWTREREESFRVASLTSPSAHYSQRADCAHEDEFGSDSILGGSVRR